MPAREESRLSGESSTLGLTLWAGVWPGKPHFQMNSPGNPPGEAGQGPAVAARWAAGRDRMTSSSLPLRFPCSLVQGRCSEKEPEWEERLPTSAFSRLPGEFPELCPGFHPVGFCPLVLPGVSHSPPGGRRLDRLALQLQSCRRQQPVRATLRSPSPGPGIPHWEAGRDRPFHSIQN